MSRILKRDDVVDQLSLEARLEYDAGSNIPATGKIISATDLADRNEGGALLNQARLDADAIRKQARDLYAQVELKIDEAKKRGYQDGFQEGQKVALAAQTKAQIQLEQKIKIWEKDAVSLIFEIARKLIGESLATSESSMIGMVRQTMLNALGNQMMILLHPDDFARMRDHQPQLQSTLQSFQTLQLKASESIPLHSCVIESDMGSVEANLDDMLQAIQKILEEGK